MPWIPSNEWPKIRFTRKTSGTWRGKVPTPAWIASEVSAQTLMAKAEGVIFKKSLVKQTILLTPVQCEAQPRKKPTY